MIKLYFFLASMIILSFTFYCCQDDVVIVRIDDLSLEKTYDIPLKRQLGWVTRSIEIIENTSVDTIWFGSESFIEPKWTGLWYQNDEYNAGPTTCVYKPYKSPKGAITFKYTVSK
jgi:hypothetical protein